MYVLERDVALLNKPNVLDIFSEYQDIGNTLFLKPDCTIELCFENNVYSYVTRISYHF